VGAQRAGTSWWYRTIELHPRVVRVEGQAKELHYFDRFWGGDPPADFVESYHRLFPRPEGHVTGEWTPRYMYDFWSLRLLAQAAPDARILVLLRDPVERYRSGLARHVKHGLEVDAPVNLMMLADAISRGTYEPQLRRVLDFFDRERVLVLQYEHCVADPAGRLAETCRFLGLEPLEQLPPAATERRRPPNPKQEMPETMRQDLVARLEGDVARLVELWPELDLAAWPNFAHLAGAGRPPATAAAGGAVPR
jgi:hypothetical protein